MRIEIEIDDARAPGVAQWLTEQGAKLADRATPLPGHSVGDSAAVLKLCNDIVGSVTQRLLDLAEPRPSRGEV